MDVASARLKAGEDRRVQLLESEIAELRRQLHTLQTDPVTSVAVRRVFERELLRQRSGKRTADRFGILMIDIDHFKQYNDRHGHQEGDLELRRVAQIIQKHLRPTDLLARYGGEEFVVIVPRADRLLLMRLAERIRMGVWLGEPFSESMGVKNETTVSVGFALSTQDDGDGWAVVKRADAALYEAKNAGRNGVRG